MAKGIWRDSSNFHEDFCSSSKIYFQLMFLLLNLEPVTEPLNTEYNEKLKSLPPGRSV